VHLEAFDTSTRLTDLTLIGIILKSQEEDAVW